MKSRKGKQKNFRIQSKNKNKPKLVTISPDFGKQYQTGEIVENSNIELGLDDSLIL